MNSEDEAWDSISEAFDAHNNAFDKMLEGIEKVDVPLRNNPPLTWPDGMRWQDWDGWVRDERGRFASLRDGEPLWRFGARSSFNWTLSRMESSTVANLAAEVASLMNAEPGELLNQLKRGA